jgi:mRNA guanylyltransferase
LNLTHSLSSSSSSFLFHSLHRFSIKWKPPSENTIDFKLRLHFPPDLANDPRGNVPDLTAKPFFALEEYMGNERNGDGYRYFDWLHVEDEEWDQ